VAFAGKFQMNDKNAITPRYEWFKDRDNNQGTGLINRPGLVCAGTECDAIQEFTFTYEHKWTQGLLARFEYRHDWTTDKQAFLERGSKGVFNHQDTLALGIVAFFGPH
jgi:hypothetical protein